MQGQEGRQPYHGHPSRSYTELAGHASFFNQMQMRQKSMDIISRIKEGIHGIIARKEWSKCVSCATAVLANQTSIRRPPSAASNRSTFGSEKTEASRNVITPVNRLA